MKRRQLLVAIVCVCVSLALFAALAVPHGHASPGDTKDDCAVCHAHKTRAVVWAEAHDAPEFVVACRIETGRTYSERMGPRSRNASRAPPA